MRSAIRLLNLLLVGSLGFSSTYTLTVAMRARLGSPVDSVAGLNSQAGPAKPNALPATNINAEALTLVLEQNIFGAQRKEMPRQEEDHPEQQAAPPAKPLELVLRGISILGELVAFAFISEGTQGPEHTYRQGECVPLREEPRTECLADQGLLEQVLGNSILVRHQGQQLEFYLDRQAEPSAAKPAVRTSTPQRKSITLKPSSSSGSSFPVQERGGVLHVQVPNAEVSKAFENFSDVLQDARVVAFNRDGVRGFQIRSIRPGSLYDRLNLKNNDIIQSVNGESITTADKALQLLTAFRNEKRIDLELMRGGRNTRLRYRIE